MAQDQIGYEIMKTRCDLCHRRLKDPESVQLGIGPTCREEWLKLTGEKIPSMRQKRRAVELVLTIRNSEDYCTLIPAALELYLLGFHVAFYRLMRHFGTCLVTIKKHEKYGDEANIFCPYNEKALMDWRYIPSRRWDARKKCNAIHMSDIDEVHGLLQTHYRGYLLLDETEKTLTVID